MATTRFRREQVYILSSIVMGASVIAEWMPDEMNVSDEQRADLVADMVQGALEVSLPGPDRLAEISRTFLEYLDHSLALYRERFEQDLDS